MMILESKEIHQTDKIRILHRTRVLLVQRVFSNVVLSVTFLSLDDFCYFSLVYSVENAIQL